MTLDKFGRHLFKNNSVPHSMSSDPINISEYMFYNIILRFEAKQISKDNKYVLTMTNTTHYTFPLDSGSVENVWLSSKNINISVNDLIIPMEEILHFPLKFNDRLSFIANENKETKTNSLFVELILKCPIIFQEHAVTSEKAYYKH